jgi:ATP-binding cassette, subfamily B, bacterial MsbA
MSWTFKALFADPYGAPALIRRLVTEYGVANWKRYAVAFVLMGVAAACMALSAYLFGHVVNQAYVDHDFRGLAMLAGIVIAISLVRALASYGSTLTLLRIGNRIVAANQRRMFAKLLNESLGFFADRHSSEFALRLTTGAIAANQVLNLLIAAVGRDLLSVIGLVIVMLAQDPVLFLVSVVVFPPALLLLRKMARRIRTVGRSQFTGNTQILETMQEALQGMRIVKAFTLEDVARKRFDAHVTEVEAQSNKMARVASRSSPLMEAIGGVAISLAIVYGGYRVIVVGATPGAFFSFLAAILLVNEPVKRLARLNIDLSASLVGVRVLYEVIDSKATEPPDDDKPPLKLTDARLEFRDVQFAYRPGEPVIHGMSFVAEPGRVTALVGPSGGGKSTLLNLILRFYDIQGGAIVIDGRSIADVPRHSLRSQIGYVGQDVFLFRGSIRENIAFGKPGASEDEIVAAAKAAYAHDFISSFPLGYDTPVGEHGTQLSGGQRQRVSVARALIKNAPIVLLDEATASLDSESEQLVQEAIARLCQGRTTIVIAHRLHTITHADRILVVENGTIAEQGRHQELLRKGGRYASFYRLQLQEQEPHEPIAITGSG